MTTNKQPGRQGDVLLIRVDAIPTSATPVPAVDSRLILREGEATGHHHSVLAEDAEMYATADAAECYLRVVRETTLTHQEHPSITYPPGDYLIAPAMEYHPRELPRMVVD